MDGLSISDLVQGLHISDSDLHHVEAHNPVASTDHNFESSSLNILELPPEILLRIFVHIDIRHIFKTVILTCKHFYEILSEPDIWNTVFSLKWQRTKLTKDHDYIADWKDVYFAFDDINNFWMRKDKWKLQCKQLYEHSAPIDAVHVMPGSKFAMSGSRDRNVIVWDIENFSHGNGNDSDVKEVTTLSGHTGWVWSVTDDPEKPNEVITGSWDKRVKVWDLNRNGENIETYSYHPSAILTLSIDESLIYTGCYDKRVRSFDPRSGEAQVITSHKGPILSLIIDGHLILSGSEDKTINICDRRMTPYPVSSLSVGSGVLCMNLTHKYGFNYLRVGSLNGMLYTYDTTNQNFVFLDSQQLWEHHKVQKLEHFHGALIACASTGYFQAYTPDRGLKFLKKQQEHTSDISSAFVRNDVLITGADTVCLWKYHPVED